MDDDDTNFFTWSNKLLEKGREQFINLEHSFWDNQLIVLLWCVYMIS